MLGPVPIGSNAADLVNQDVQTFGGITYLDRICTDLYFLVIPCWIAQLFCTGLDLERQKPRQIVTSTSGLCTNHLV